MLPFNVVLISVTVYETPVNLSISALAAECLASFFDFPAPIAEQNY